MTTLVAMLNALSTIFLSFAIYYARKKEITKHLRFIGLSLTTATILLIVFLYDKIVLSDSLKGYLSHGLKGSTSLRLFLASHIMASIITLPLIAITIHRAYKKQHRSHKFWARITAAMWYYASITGIALYIFFAK